MNRDLPLNDPDVFQRHLFTAPGWNTLQPESVTKSHSVCIIKKHWDRLHNAQHTWTQVKLKLTQHFSHLHLSGGCHNRNPIWILFFPERSQLYQVYHHRHCYFINRLVRKPLFFFYDHVYTHKSLLITYQSAIICGDDTFLKWEKWTRADDILHTETTPAPRHRKAQNKRKQLERHTWTYSRWHIRRLAITWTSEKIYKEKIKPAAWNPGAVCVSGGFPLEEKNFLYIIFVGDAAAAADRHLTKHGPCCCHTLSKKFFSFSSR